MAVSTRRSPTEPTRRYGLDVTILPGGPQKNNRLLLAAGSVDFYMGDNLIGEFSALAENIPIVTVAAIFQKDPLVFMSHPGAGLDRFEDLPKAKAFVGLATLTTVWPWMEKKWGFSRDRKSRPIISIPRLSSPTRLRSSRAMLTSEPFAIAREGGFQPNVFLLADHGYETYATTIETRRDLLEKNPDLVRRFVEASILGWVHYLHGDNRAANALIKRENPDMDDAQIAFSIAQMKALRHCRIRRRAETGDRRDGSRAHRAVLSRHGRGGRGARRASTGARLRLFLSSTRVSG